MTVIGVGETITEPNVAVVELGVMTEDQELVNAQQQNAAIMTRVIDSLISLGVARENIKTKSYTVNPQYDYSNGKQEFRGYQVTNTITVKMKALEEMPIIIDTAVQNGANHVSAIKFSVENPEIYYQQALGFALENAVAKAQTIAGTMQLQLDPTPIKIVEELGDPVMPFQSFAAMELKSSTPIEPGLLKIEAKVTVQFEY